MKIPLPVCYLLAGYGPPNAPARCVCFTAGWAINLDTRRGRLVMWVIETTRAIRGKPSDFRYWPAELKCPFCVQEGRSAAAAWNAFMGR